MNRIEYQMLFISFSVIFFMYKKAQKWTALITVQIEMCFNNPLYSELDKWQIRDKAESVEQESGL